MLRKGNRSLGKNLAVDDGATHGLRPASESLPHCNEPLCIVRLFRRTGASIHDAHTKRCHIPIEPRQLSQQLPVFPDHG